MARCEDWPCCGHEAGCCPDFNEAGEQLNMKCTCGAVLPVNARFSICESCMNAMDEDGDRFDDRDDEPDVDELTEHQDFEQADEYFDHGREDFGDWGEMGMHED